LIAFYLFLQTKFLLKAEFVKYGSCVIYGWRRLYANWISVMASFIFIYILDRECILDHINAFTYLQ
jgi:hypothetical protein